MAAKKKKTTKTKAKTKAKPLAEPAKLAKKTTKPSPKTNGAPAPKKAASGGGGSGGAGGPIFREPAFDAPDDEWLVYADVLQEANDPRGTLIALDAGIRSGKTSVKERDAFLAKNATTLLGKANAHLSAYRLHWRWGLIDNAELVVRAGDKAASVKDRLGALLKAPAASRLRALSLVGVVENTEKPVNLAPAVTHLAKSGLFKGTFLSLVDERASQCTRLASRDFDPETNLVTFGSLESLWSLPNLESVSITVADPSQVDFGSLDVSNIRSFCLRGLAKPSAALDELASVKWPKLESFELRLTEMWMANIPDDGDAYAPAYAGLPNGKLETVKVRKDDEEDEEKKKSSPSESDDEMWDENFERPDTADWKDLTPLLKKLQKAPLKRLALTAFNSSGPLLKTVLDTGLPKTLEELDLSDSGLESNDVKTMLKKGAKLKGLKRLVLKRTTLSKADVKKLSKLGPEIVHTHRNQVSYRFVVGSE